MLNRMHLDPWSPSTIRPLWHSACHMCRLDISAWNLKWRFKIFHWIFSLLFLTIPVQFFCWQNRNFCLWTLGIAQSQNQWSVWHLNYRSLACVFEEFRFCYLIFCFVLKLFSRMPFHFYILIHQFDASTHSHRLNETYISLFFLVLGVIILPIFVVIVVHFVFFAYLIYKAYKNAKRKYWLRQKEASLSFRYW